MTSFKTVLKAALLVGTLDICAAFIQVYAQSGTSPFKPVLHFVASGLFDKNAGLNEGETMAAGLLIHYLIATAFTVFFFLFVARFSFAKTHRLLTGTLYGAFIWAVMNLLVLPLTKTRPFVFHPSKNALAMGILIVCIGIPLAFLANRKTNLKHAAA
jgi:uncharacterized membrane protein YagU involved in acid resistance